MSYRSSARCLEVGAVLPVLLLVAVSVCTQVPSSPVQLDPIEERADLEEWPAEMEEAWSDKAWREVVAFADKRIEAEPEDHRGHTLKYLALLELRADRDAARRCAARATRTLAGKPLQLVEFIDRGLFSDPETAEFQLALMALVPVLPAARHSARVRIATCAMPRRWHPLRCRPWSG
jgi:hypothetical protein